MVSSAELTTACSDLCTWGQEEGVLMFIIRATDDGNVQFIGPKLPGAIVAKMLRQAAIGYEQQVGAHTLQ